MAVKRWQRLPGKVLLVTLQLFTAVALLFEGYNQGVMGSVSGTADFIRVTDIGVDGIITNTTKQGGLVAAYYFGAMLGCFFAGWFGDAYGRKRGVWFGSLWCILGGALMSAAQNSNMFICARIIAGIGIGFINTLIPPWVSELAKAHSRGVNFTFVFISNYVGITLAYWINYAVGFTNRPEFMWRFPLAFMTVPVIMVAATIAFLPDSPRWLIANGRRDEAVQILAKVRGDLSPNDPTLTAELEELDAIVAKSRQARNRVWNLALGRHSGALHLGRRAWMGFFLMQMLMWSGIMAIATYSGELFKVAGFDAAKSAWMGGLCNSLSGVVGTAAAAIVIDRWGRIKSLLMGFTTQGISLYIVAACLKVGQDSTDNPSKALALGTAASSFFFVFLWCFCMFVIVPCFLYPSEIWPQEVRAQGYAFTVFGWAMGSGLTTLLIPIMLKNLGYGTFLLFGSFNIIAIPTVYFLYPEVCGRSLEEVNLLFTSSSLLVASNEREYKRRLAEAGGHVAVAERRLLDEVDGLGKEIALNHRENSLTDCEKGRAADVSQLDSAPT